MKTGNNWSRKIFPFLACTVFAVACNDGSGGRNSSQFYSGTVAFRMVGDSTGAQDFVVVTNDFDLIDLALAEQQLPFSERTLFPIGPIAHGDGHHNFDQSGQSRFEWNWHFVPEEWALTDVADPLCDGNALVVEQAIDFWVDTVGQFCPSGARIISATMRAP